MITHKATISKLSNEFLSLIGFSFDQIYLQTKGLLIFELAKGETSLFVEFSTNSPYDRIIIRDKHTRAKANTKDLFPILLGETITNASQVDEDRILAISTTNYVLYFKLFGHKQSDFLLASRKNKILYALNETALIGTTFSTENVSQTEIADFEDAKTLRELMLHCKYYFGKYYTQKFLSDNGLKPETPLQELDRASLADDLGRYYYKIAKSEKSYVYKLSEDKYLFSLLPLDGYELFGEYESASQGIRVKFVQEISKKRLFELRKKATDKLDKLIAKDSKAILQISQLSDGTEESEKFKHYAEILISQPNAKAKFGNKAKFDDWDGSKISIPLDEKLTLIENSHKYFKKASSILKERAFVKNKLNGLIEKVAVNKQLQEEIGTTDKLKELENLLFENRKTIGIMVEKQETQAKEDKFKKYMLSEGFVLYVGKNAKNNDELTLRFAKPNDIWLHARGVSGSHCVIRVDGREPSKGIIKEAAAIAAFYSKAKTSHLAPVAYTQKKYVSKPKGANPGAVVIRREEVILVEPFQPD